MRLHLNRYGGLSPSVIVFLGHCAYFSVPFQRQTAYFPPPLLSVCCRCIHMQRFVLKPTVVCVVQCNKSGGYGAAVGCYRLAHSAGGGERRWLFSIRIISEAAEAYRQPVFTIHYQYASLRICPRSAPRPCCYARRADY